MTDLLYSEVEDDLRASVRSLVNGRMPVEATLARIEAGPFDANAWRSLAAEMGLAGLAVPERFGGAGASLREAGVVLEELGRAVAPVPYLASSVVATTVLVRADAGDLLGKLGSGERIAVLAVPLASAGGAPATVEAPDGRLSGTIAGIGDGLAADLLLVPTSGGLYAVEATAAGVTRTAVASLDMTRPLADVVLADATGQLLASGEAADAAVRAGLIAGAALLASEQLGLAEWCLQTTVEYVKTRHQFGRPIGGFQAIKHRLADVWVELAQARAVARYAAVCAATDDPDLPVAASLAQAYCSPMAVKAAEECVQLHGGIGFTWEHPAHLYLKRAKASALAYGTADHHRQLLAGLVDLPA